MQNPCYMLVSLLIYKVVSLYLTNLDKTLIFITYVYVYVNDIDIENDYNASVISLHKESVNVRKFQSFKIKFFTDLVDIEYIFHFSIGTEHDQNVYGTLNNRCWVSQFKNWTTLIAVMKLIVVITLISRTTVIPILNQNFQVSYWIRKNEVSVRKPEILARKHEVSGRKNEVSVRKPKVSVRKPEVSVQNPEVSGTIFELETSVKVVYRNASVAETRNFELQCTEKPLFWLNES
jgi:hypothetical protein